MANWNCFFFLLEFLSYFILLVESYELVTKLFIRPSKTLIKIIVYCKSVLLIMF